MIASIVSIVSVLLILLIASIIVRAIIKKQQIIDRPPIPLVYFLLAKILVLVNLTFLILKGLEIPVDGVFVSVGSNDVIALPFLIMGTALLFLSTFKLNADLIYGLSSSENHKLQTTGVYSISRHPFYYDQRRAIPQFPVWRRIHVVCKKN
jgi:protein-S-isoprenylcysteine O-methyltransferase Ste14